MPQAPDDDRTVPASPPFARAEPEPIRAENVEWRAGDVILDLYDVLGVVGEGGMGTVYRVHHRVWDVDLAVKTPRAAVLMNAGGAAAFERECDAWIELGMHSHIVSCHYVRTIGTTPRAFVEYADGGSLAEAMRSESLYAGDPDLALQRVLDRTIQSACGLQYIHARELVHQDVKPANIMLTSDGTAKMTDFGLARAFGGTPEYFSPEQATAMANGRGRDHSVLTRQTDVWSWALTLLEMLLGERTWSFGEVAAEVLRMGVRPAPGLPFRTIPNALHQLLARCFAEDPWARPDMNAVVTELVEIYASLTGRRYPRPLSEPPSMKASAMNNRGASFIDLHEPQKAVASWERVLDDDPWNLEARFNLGYARWRNGDLTDTDLVASLTRMEATYRSRPEYWRLVAAVQQERGDLEALEQLRAEHPFLEASARPDGAVGRQVRTFGELTMNWYARGGSLSADGRLLLIADWGSKPGLRLLDMDTGKELGSLIHDSDLSTHGCAARLSADGTRAAACVGNAIRVWDTQTGREVTAHRAESGTPSVSLALSPDGRLAASTVEKDRTVALWDATTGETVATLGPVEYYSTVHLAFSPDGTRLLAPHDHAFVAWDVRSGAVAVTFERRCRDLIRGLAFSRDGRFVLSTESRGVMRFWNSKTGEQVTSVRDADASDEHPSLSSDGKLAFVCGSQWSRLWDLSQGRVLRSIENGESRRTTVGFLPGDRHVVLTAGRAIEVWELAFDDVRPRHFPVLSRISGAREATTDAEKAGAFRRRAEEELQAGHVKAAVSAARDAQSIAGYERRKEVLDVLARCHSAGGGRRVAIRDAWVAHAGSGARATALSPDGRIAAEVVSNVWLRDTETWARIEELQETSFFCRWIAFSPDSRRVLTLSPDISPAKVHDVETGGKLFEIARGDAGKAAMVFLPNGDRVLGGGSDGVMRIWDLASGRQEASFSSTAAPDRYRRGIDFIDITPDGRIAISCGRSDLSSGTIQLWDVVEGREIARLEGHRGLVRCVRVSADGRIAVSGAEDGTIRVWDLRARREKAVMRANETGVLSVACSPDWRHVLASGKDQTLRLFDLETQEQIWMMPIEAHDLYFHPSGRYVLARNVGLLELDWEWEIERAQVAVPATASVPRPKTKSAEPEPCRRRGALQSIIEIASLKREGEQTGLIALSRDGRMTLACGSRLTRHGGSAFANVWDLGNRRVLRQLATHGDGYSSGYRIHDCHATADFSHAATAGSSVTIWDVPGGRAIRRIETEADHVRLTGSAKYVVTASHRTLSVWHTATGRLVRSIEAHATSVLVMDVSADGQLAITADQRVPMGGKSSELKVWELATGRCVACIPISVSAACFSRDGQSVIAAADYDVQLLRPVTGEVLRTMEGRDYAGAPFPSIDGRYVAFAGYEPMLLDLDSGARHSFAGHSGCVQTACFTDDMQTAVTADEEGTIKVWQLHWQMEDVLPSEWDEGARPFMEAFLRQRVPYTAQLPAHRQATEAEIIAALTRGGRPRLEHGDFELLMGDLAAAGYPHLTRSGVRRKLDMMITRAPSDRAP